MEKLEKVKVEDFANIKSVSNVKYSPNGKNACFVVTTPNLDKSCYENNIYAYKNGEVIKLTGLGKEKNYDFLDDDTIWFIADRDEDNKNIPSTKFYKISLNGGEAEKFLELPLIAYNIKMLKNGDILFISPIPKGYPDLHLGNKEELEKFKKEQEENSDYEIIEENPFWLNGDTFTKSARQGLFYFNIKEKKIERLSEPRMYIGSYQLDKNEEYAIFVGMSGEGLLDIFEGNAYRIDLKTKNIEKIINKEDIVIASDINLIGDKYYFFGNKHETGVCTDSDIYSLKDGVIELEKKFGLSLGLSVATDVRLGMGCTYKVIGDDIYFLSTQYDKAVILKYNVNNKRVTEVLGNYGSVESFDIYNNKILFVSFFDMKPQELYSYDLKKKEFNQITNFNTEYVNTHFISKPEMLFFQSKKDIIHGFVLKPIDYDEKKKYPVILDIHGGPKNVYGEVFYHEMQYWCSEGYFVIYCNPTGSDGRGRRFADIRGKYGTIDYDDIMSFCDEALNKYPQMDKDNFFETGGSYGGFMTNWIIGHTNRFKACASQRSIANWISFYGLSDIGVIFSNDQNAGNPWDDTDKLWWHSPLKYAPNVKTPTLFIHSDQDYRCPMPEAMQMFTALLTYGVDTRLVYFKGENHDLSRSGKPKHRLKRLNEITGWFNKYLDDKYK